MRHQDNPTDALFEADDAALRRIAALCPADWDDDAVFQRAYQKYQGETCKPLHRIRHFDVMRFAVTAACLLVMCGGIGGLYALHQLAPEPESPIIHEQLPTETTTEITTGSSTETTAAETTAASASVTALTTSLPAATTAAQTVPVTDIPASETPETAVSGDAAVITPSTETVPAATAAVIPQTTAAETAPPPTEPVTEAATESIPETEPAHVGFVELHDGSTYQFRFEGAQSLPLETGSYVIDLADCTINENETSERFRRFAITQTWDDTWYHYYTIDHFTYEEFQYSCRIGSIAVQQTAVGTHDGYLITSEDCCVLFWDDGTGVAMTSSELDKSSELLRIAAAFHQS